MGDSMARAKELIDLIGSPTALATGVLIAFAMSQMAKNDEGLTRRGRTWWALVSSGIALLLTVAVVAVMTPLAIRVMYTNRGNSVETRLLVYVLTYVVALGTTGYAFWSVLHSWEYLQPSGRISRFIDRVFRGRKKGDKSR